MMIYGVHRVFDELKPDFVWGELSFHFDDVMALYSTREKAEQAIIEMKHEESTRTKKDEFGCSEWRYYDEFPSEMFPYTEPEKWKFLTLFRVEWNKTNDTPENINQFRWYIEEMEVL